MRNLSEERNFKKVLNYFKKDVLERVCNTYDLFIKDTKEGIIGSLIDCDYEPCELLEGFTKDELKSLCRNWKLAIDSNKDDLITNILDCLKAY